MLQRALKPDSFHEKDSWPTIPAAEKHALKPSPPSVINALKSSQPTSANSLKRTSSQVSGWEHTSNLGHSQKRAAMRDPAVTGNRVGQLHFNVTFDENDFDDDDNIDLNEDTLVVKRESLPSSNSSHLLPEVSTRTISQAPSSSAPLPWSSSPLDHHQSLQPKRQPEGPPPAKSVKRRALPWNNVQSASGTEANTKTPQNQLHDKISGLKYSNDEDMDRPEVDSTRRKFNSPYPWNKTASALKEEQKRLRQGHKRHIKDIESKDVEAVAKKKRESMATVFLSDEQKLVMKLVAENKKSVFFTGSAGTGKSVLLREIIRELRGKYRREPDRVAVTASTGLAACNVGGVTLHSFAGIGLGKEPAPELVRKVKRNQKAKQRWLRTKVLIVDEVSMVDGELFDKLEEIARSIRNNGRPFGGIQLVITGDFFQLPPVPDGGRVSKFSFDASTWSTSIEHTIGLTHVFRQKDPVFANMLNEMRLGKLTTKSIDSFRALGRPLNFEDDFAATELFPTRMEVDNANNAKMQRLGGMEKEFKAIDGGSITDIHQRQKLLANCMAAPTITLKKGAQVMLIKNIDETLVNGSVGRVVNFMTETRFDHYIEHEDDYQEIDDMNQSEEAVSSREKIRELTNDKEPKTSTSQIWPLVRFRLPDGNTRELLCQPEPWNIELPSGEIQASRLQVPLILAWALSIHKAQGQTLARVKVDLGKIFEKGQAYVALSRATCQEGLQVTRFDPKKVMAHDRVRTFYDGLYSVQKALE